MRFFRRNSFAVLGGLAVCWTLGAQAAPIAQLRFSFELNGGPVTTIVDGGPGDTDGVINGSIVLGTITPIPGYTVFGSVTSSDGTINDGGLLAGFNVLDSGATKVVNRSGGPVHVQAAFSAYGFTPWANVAFSTGSGTFEVSNGAPITLKYYDDPNNAWGASTPFDTPGNLIDTYSFTASGFHWRTLSPFLHPRSSPTPRQRKLGVSLDGRLQAGQISVDVCVCSADNTA